jgi:hypothetical protein
MVNPRSPPDLPPDTGNPTPAVAAAHYPIGVSTSTQATWRSSGASRASPALASRRGNGPQHVSGAAMRSVFLAVALLAGPSIVNADAAPASDWIGARPGVTIRVAPAAESGAYQVEAEIKDLRSGAILSSPRLTILAGKAGLIHVGADDGAMVKISVEVDPVGQHVTYSTEVLDHTVVQTSHSATIALK